MRRSISKTILQPKAVKVIRSHTRYALTGTPIENRLSELWSIFDYLMPGFFYGYDTFKKDLETPIVKNGDQSAMARLQKTGRAIYSVPSLRGCAEGSSGKAGRGAVCEI